MRYPLALLIIFLAIPLYGQRPSNLILKGEYTRKDSIDASVAYLNAKKAVELMHNSMNEIWELAAGQSKPASHRVQRWNNNDSFARWLGKPEKMGLAKRRINRLYSRFKRTVILDITKENKGRCTGWISAWAIPFGKVRIRLCEDYFIYRTHLQDKIIVHEMGHEIGMLSHKKIHGCWAARKAAASGHGNIAKRSPENYAWLAMSFLGLQCSY